MLVNAISYTITRNCTVTNNFLHYGPSFFVYIYRKSSRCCHCGKMFKVIREILVVVFITSIVWFKAIEVTALFENPTPPKAVARTSDQYRIRGGRNAAVGAFPWMAALMYYVEITDTFKFLCGGSLINNRHVITAAHCVQPALGTLSFVRLGGHNIVTLEDNAHDVPVEDTIMHPDYSMEALLHDVGIIKLSRTVDFTEFIRPILLPESRRSDFEGGMAVVAGWGGHSYHNRYRTLVLQTVDVPVLYTKFCLKTLTTEFHDAEEYLICADNRTTGTWKGDSGGPLMLREVDGDNDQYYIIGITSFGRPWSVTFYTRVSTYLDWISDNISS